MNKLGYTEAELRDRFISEIRISQGYQAFPEVPVFTRSVDLVLQNHRTSEITAIEFKLHDWKRAILQVQGVALCFDHLSVCIPKPKTPAGEQSVMDACSKNEIGLYLYDRDNDTFIEVIESPKVETVWQRQKERIMCYLEANKYEYSSTHP